MNRIAVLWLCLAVAGCAHVRVGTDGLSFEQRRARLEAVEDWQMRGRLAVDTGERAFQGRFQWQHSPQSLSLSVRGPLGGGILQVSGPPQRLVVTAQGETRVLTNPEAELSALLGWWLPVESLHSWLIGLPDPDFRSRTRLGPEGVLASLEQRQWRLEYPSYQLTEGLLLPRRIDLRHAGLTLRVFVDDWRPGGALNSAARAAHNTAPGWGVAKW